MSIVIPVYNVENYLEECLDSVVNQTYQNLEVIAINDGSTDDSGKILKKYSQQYEFIKVIYQENSGNSVARNQGIQNASGKYIYFLDSDDYILPETINNLVDTMEKNKLDLIRFGAEPFLDGADYKLDKNLYDYSKFFEHGKIYDKKEFLRASIRGFSPSPCLYILKKDLLEQNNIHFYPGIMHEDELFSLLVYLHTNCAMYDTNLYYKRRYREGSIMTSQQYEKTKKSFDSYCKLIEIFNDLLKKYQIDDEKRLIKSRIRSIYIGLKEKNNINKTYKKEKISQLSGVTINDKLYYTMIYRMKKIVRSII